MFVVLLIFAFFIPTRVESTFWTVKEIVDASGCGPFSLDINRLFGLNLEGIFTYIKSDMRLYGKSYSGDNMWGSEGVLESTVQDNFYNLDCLQGSRLNNLGFRRSVAFVTFNNGTNSRTYGFNTPALTLFEGPVDALSGDASNAQIVTGQKLVFGSESQGPILTALAENAERRGDAVTPAQFKLVSGTNPIIEFSSGSDLTAPTLADSGLASMVSGGGVSSDNINFAIALDTISRISFTNFTYLTLDEMTFSRQNPGVFGNGPGVFGTTIFPPRVSHAFDLGKEATMAIWSENGTLFYNFTFDTVASPVWQNLPLAVPIGNNSKTEEYDVSVFPEPLSALVVWADHENNRICSNVFNFGNNEWVVESGEPIVISSSTTDIIPKSGSSVSVSSTNNGNSIATWVAQASDADVNPTRLYAAVYVANIGQWLQPELIAEGEFALGNNSLPPRSVINSMAAMISGNDQLEAVIGWSDCMADERASVANRAQSQIAMLNPTTEFNTVENTVLRVMSPVEVAISPTQVLNAIPSQKQIMLNRFATQAEFVNYIAWQKVNGSLGYNVYRNVDCSAVPSGAPLSFTRNTFFNDHNRVPNNTDSYCIASVNRAMEDTCNLLLWPIIPGADSYNIIRNDGSVDVTLNQTPLRSTETSFVDYNIVPGVTFTYRLQINTKVVGSGCNMITWANDTSSCGYNIYRANNGEASCLLQSKSIVRPDNGMRVLVDCNVPASQEYIVAKRIMPTSGDCTQACDMRNIITWDASAVPGSAKAGGFNIYRDGVFVENQADSPYIDSVDTINGHTYVVVATDSFTDAEDRGNEQFPINGVKTDPACPSSIPLCQ